MSELRYEYCDVCGSETGRAGVGDGSIFCNDCGRGPLCEGCWSEHEGNPHRCSEAAAKAASVALILEGDPGDEAVRK